MESQVQTLDLKSARALQTVVVIILIFIMSAVFMVKISKIDAQMERAAIDQTLTILRSGMQIHVFSKIMQGKHSEVSALEDTDPMLMLSTPVSNYLGAVSRDHIKNQSPGNWYFDKQSKELVYQIRYASIFLNEFPDRELRFKVKVSYSDNNNNVKYDPFIDNLHGLNLLPVKRKKITLVLAEEKEYGRDE